MWSEEGLPKQVTKPNIHERKKKQIDRFDDIKRCKISVHKLNINETTDGKICELYQKFKDS